MLHLLWDTWAYILATSYFQKDRSQHILSFQLTKYRLVPDIVWAKVIFGQAARRNGILNCVSGPPAYKALPESIGPKSLHIGRALNLDATALINGNVIYAQGL